MFINDLFNDDDKLNESLKGMTSSLKHSLRSPSLDSKKPKKQDTFGLTGELAETEHDWGEYEDGDEEEQQDEGFFVAIGSEDDGAFVGMVTKDGGKWRESAVSGNAPYGWGGNYMSYLTPDDVMQHIRNDYGRHSQVKGPFSTEEAAVQYAQNHFDLGSDDDDYDDHLNELSNEKLGQYKKAAAADASAADARGDYKHGDKRFKGIVKATIKQGDNDSKKKINELGKDTLKRYARANVDDRMLRATGDSFRSGKAGDAYNNAPYDTPYDKKRERGFDRALDKLSKKGVSEATGDAKFDSMMGKMTSPESLNSREAVEMIFDLMHNSGASYKEALHQASVSYEIDPAELQALYKQQSRSLGEQGMAEDKQLDEKMSDAEKKAVRSVHRAKYGKETPTVSQTKQTIKFVKNKQQGVAEGKKPDNYHIVNKDGKPATLASYADRASAEKDRDAKHPGSEVRQVGPRGKVKGVSEGFNRPDDHRGLGRELSHETNNIEISINGRVWKIFAGKGPDNSPEFFRQKQSVDAMCKRKTQETGKKWSWGVTGAAATNEGWKSAVAGAALAGSMALGGGVAHAAEPVIGVGQSQDMQRAVDMAKMNAKVKYMKTIHGDSFNDQQMPQHHWGKVELKPNDRGGYSATVPLIVDDESTNEAIDLSKLRAATGAKVDTTIQDKIKQNRPRNFVAKNAINSGAGKHIDKKKAVKQGVEKHKKPVEIDEDYELLQAVAESMERSGYEFTEAANPAQQAAIAINMKKQHKKPHDMDEGWSAKYKRSINCSHPKGFSQKAHCAGKKKHNESIEMEAVCPDCGMCKTHGNNMIEVKQRLDAKCWTGYKKQGTKLKGGVRVNNCVPK